MIKFNEETQQYEQYRLKVTFYNLDEKRVKYDDTEKYWREFIDKWWHHSDLKFQPLVLTDAQQARLTEINEQDIPKHWVGTVSIYVETGSVDDGTACPYLTTLVDDPNVVEARLEAVRVRLREDLESHRFKVETGGVVMADGSRILTDRESQSQLSNAFHSLKDGVVTTVDWKGPDGWVEVTEVELRPIAEVAAKHVQVAFTAERTVDEDEITLNDDLASLQEMDVKARFDETFALLMS